MAAINPPSWAKNAVPTLTGWRDPRSNELLKSQIKNLNDNKNYNFVASEKTPLVFESIPGCSHVIKNNSNKKAVILVWSNEVFYKEKSDTYRYKINVKN